MGTRAAATKTLKTLTLAQEYVLRPIHSEIEAIAPFGAYFH
jgi:hypothetical protein